MKLRVTKVAAAVAAGLGVSIVGMNVAQADAIFFPYFVMSPTVTTILTVNNEDTAAIKQLHYRYYRKESNVNDAVGTNSALDCKEFDFWQDTSPNDLVSFDMGGVNGNPVFGNPANGVMFEPKQSKPVVYGQDFASLGRTNIPKRGYVLVDNSSPTSDADPLPAPGAKLGGEAIIIEFTTGSAWGYRAYSAAGIWGYIPPAAGAAAGSINLSNRYDFSDRVEVNGQVLTAPPPGVALPAADVKANYWSPFAFMPWSEVTTKLFVTPVAAPRVGGANDFQGPNSFSAYAASIRLSATSQAADRVVFNRDETPYSGARPQNVTCVGAVPLADLVDENVKQQTPQGGWTNVAVNLPVAGGGTLPATAVHTSQAVVFKAEYNPTNPSTLAGVPIQGSWNNVVWLEKGIRESLMRLLTSAVGTPGNGWGYIPTYEIPGIEFNAPYFPISLPLPLINCTATPLPFPPPAVFPAVVATTPVAVSANCPTQVTSVVLSGAEYYGIATPAVPAPVTVPTPAAVTAAVKAGNVFTCGTGRCGC